MSSFFYRWVVEEKEANQSLKYDAPDGRNEW